MKFLAALLLGLLLASSVPAQQSAVGGGNGYHTLLSGYPNTVLTGPVVETNMAAIRIPANSLGPNGMLRVTVFWTYTNSSNNKTLFLRYSTTPGAVTGGNIMQSFSVVTTTAESQFLYIIRNTGATNSQIAYSQPQAPYSSAAAAPITVNVDTTVDTFLNFSGTLAVGTETITLLAYTAEVIRP